MQNSRIWKFQGTRATRTPKHSKGEKAVHCPAENTGKDGGLPSSLSAIGGYACFVSGSLVVMVNSFLKAFQLYLRCNQRKGE